MAGTKLVLIITPSKVYGTYHETICYSGDNTPESIQTAKATIFNYGRGFGSVHLSEQVTDENWGDKEVFSYLEKINKIHVFKPIK